MLLTKFIIENVQVIVVVETGARRVNIRYNHFINKLVGCWYFFNFANHFTQFRKKYEQWRTHMCATRTCMRKHI